MNEISVLRILYKNRVRLLAVPVAVGVVVGALSLLSSNRYSSTAAISVQRPEVPITGELSPLRVEALRSLTGSTRVKREVFDRLRRVGRLEERIDFGRFQGMLSTQVEYVEGRERTLLPLVKLTATSSDPALAREVADQWAEVVLDETRNIYRSGVDELGAFTAAMYEEVNKSLLESEDRYVELRVELNLAGNKVALAHNQDLYSRLLKRILDLEDQIAAGEATLRQLEERLAAQEIKGIWVGELFTRERDQEGKYGLSAATSLTNRILRTIRSLEENQDALAEFEQSSRLEHKQARVKVMKRQIEEISQNVMNARVELSGVEPTHRKLTEELKDIDERITLEKTLSDDLLLDTVIRKGVDKASQFPKLLSEISNPVYLETQTEVVRLIGRIQGLKNRIVEGEIHLEELRKKVSDLIREIASLDVEKRVLQDTIERERSLFDSFALSYREDRQEYEKVEKALELAAAKLAATEAWRDEIAEKTTRLEEQVYSGENAVAQQKRDVDNLSNVRSSLAARTSEVALLRVSTENVSRSGTVLLYGAEIDPVKVGPRRARTVLISILLTFLLYSLILVLREAVRLTEPGTTAEAA